MQAGEQRLLEVRKRCGLESKLVVVVGTEALEEGLQQNILLRLHKQVRFCLYKGADAGGRVKVARVECVRAWG